jgi:class 3 adenylate cyclase
MASAQAGKHILRSYTPSHLANTILTSRSALTGERKHVTVLFADLEDSTALAQAVDPEVLHDVLDGVFEIMLAEVHRLEGTINQFTGDGIMALFGAPIAHEDHAIRALHAALGMQRAFAAYAGHLRRTRGIAVALRIGLHAGPVVVGKIGNDLRMDYTAQGVTTHLAARLQQLAGAGTIYLSETVQQQAAGFFRFDNLGAFALQGITAPVRVYACMGLSQTTSRLAASLQRGWSVFVGREQELTLLHALWSKACSGQGQVVYLLGEPGVGKSRLIHEFRRTMTAANTLEVQALPYRRSIPYAAFLPLLRSFLGLTSSTEPWQRQQLCTRLATIDAACVHAAPLLADLLGLPLEADQPAPVAPAEQRCLQHLCRQMIVQYAAAKPFCLLIEDAQWLDSGSQELLDMLVAGLARQSVLLLCTVRPDYWHAWGEQGYVHELTVAPLSGDYTDVFVHHWCWPHNASPALKALIRQRTEGNPFFIEEMLRALQEHHRLAIQNGEYVVCGDDVELPTSVQGVLAACIDRLEADLKEVVQVGAVIGQEFPLWLLEAVLGQTDLQGKLATLAQLGLIYEKALQPEPTYVFTHALTRDVAYMSLLNQVKKRLHQVIGLALESRYAERLEEQVHLLYHHFSRAEHWLKAAQYSWQAARKAHRLSQCHAAVTLFEQARACILRLPEEPSRQQALLDLQLEMIWSLRNLGQPDQMLSHCREADVRTHWLNPVLT